MTDPQVKVIAQVIQERKNQDRQWGGPTHDDTHSTEDWIRYMGHQIDKIFSVQHGQFDRAGFIKIAALAVAAIESIDRKENQDEA